MKITAVLGSPRENSVSTRIAKKRSKERGKRDMR